VTAVAYITDSEQCIACTLV